MTKLWGLALAGLFAGACGHATPTGSARNDWATPTGYANATDPRVINPNAPEHRVRDRSLFATSAAPPPVQPAPSQVSAPPVTNPELQEAVPPPPEELPPPETVPDVTPIRP
ncbi:MAG TPA: hypothetical protein VN947_10110 [Polyangia bacterium]|nr:hypothetical protein [Polyangia bacterium]